MKTMISQSPNQALYSVPFPQNITKPDQAAREEDLTTAPANTSSLVLRKPTIAIQSLVEL